MPGPRPAGGRPGRQARRVPGPPARPRAPAVDALARGLRTEDELLDDVWDDAPPALRLAAGVTLRAHLGKLREEGRLPRTWTSRRWTWATRRSEAGDRRSPCRRPRRTRRGAEPDPAPLPECSSAARAARRAGWPAATALDGRVAPRAARPRLLAGAARPPLPVASVLEARVAGGRVVDRRRPAARAPSRTRLDRHAGSGRHLRGRLDGLGRALARAAPRPGRGAAVAAGAVWCCDALGDLLLDLDRAAARRRPRPTRRPRPWSR